MQKKRKKLYPAAKMILMLAGVGAFIAGSLIFPGLPMIFKGKRFNFDGFVSQEEWDKFDERRLRQRLKEMRRSKLIKIYEVDDKCIVQVTEKGKKRLLKYRLDDLEIPEPREWDGKWRIAAYDIPKYKRAASEAMRRTLQNLGFLRLQKSVYLFPYPCHNVVEFLREIYEIGENVTLLTVGYLENEEAYKRYFGL